MRDVAVVIPARYASSRFPGKPLAPILGKPMIQHVHERAATVARRVIVATDDERIATAVKAFGGEVVMTRGDHPNGTSRIAEVAATLHEDVIVNVQGDEPGLEPSLIERAVKALRAAGRGVPMATIASPFSHGEDPKSPHLVKVVVDRRGRALYFSRSVIPFARDDQPRDAADSTHAALLRHVGLYAYRRPFLATFVALEESPLERTEQLEQLRAIEHGYPIAVAVAEAAVHGIDTPEQLTAFEQALRRESP
ncbi:MAG: 3-deoxy-manno-octulosonate cytidylyltransferase [Phycisphaeraceae bacterium]|nr:3-deoxy-manno-octulosonate cytidylyltransferase [Phycisphaeraceae bacterium]